MTDVFLPAAKRIRLGTSTKIAFDLDPFMIRDAQRLFEEGIKSSSDCYDVTISLPTKHRTTGPESQNAHINGHIQQLCVETGNQFDTMKYYCKCVAIDKGYPFDTLKGIIVPWSETRISIEQASILIDVIHQIGAEENIIFKEGVYPHHLQKGGTDY